MSIRIKILKVSFKWDDDSNNQMLVDNQTPWTEVTKKEYETISNYISRLYEPKYILVEEVPVDKFNQLTKEQLLKEIKRKEEAEIKKQAAKKKREAAAEKRRITKEKKQLLELQKKYGKEKSK